MASRPARTLTDRAMALPQTMPQPITLQRIMAVTMTSTRTMPTDIAGWSARHSRSTAARDFSVGTMVGTGMAPRLAPSLVTADISSSGSPEPVVSHSHCAQCLFVRVGGGEVDSELVKDISNASFSPELIEVMKSAPWTLTSQAAAEPVSTSHVQSIAESILRTAQSGETDPMILQRMALLELQLKPRN